MAVVSSHNEQLLGRAHALFGPDLSGPPALAEALRCELSARGVASGRSLCERAQSLLRPLAAPDLGRIREVLEELAAGGDVAAGPGGMYAAAPLRAVALTPGLYAIHGALPTPFLKESLPADSLEGGVIRYVTVTPGLEDSLVDAVSRLGGIVLSAKRWAGLDRVPPAGPEWLEELNHRLAQDPGGAGALDQGLVTPWQAYRADRGGPQRQRWRSAEAEEGPSCLWRARHEHGWWRFAWTAGGSPASSPHTRLTQDEACRAQFALDRLAGTSVPALVRTGVEGVEITIDAFLPRPEYRFLTTLGRRAGAEWPPRYLVPLAGREEAEKALEERLGLRPVEGGGAP